MMVGEISGESIKSAIALKLKSSFAKTTGTPPFSLPNIYKEKIVQGIQKPYFFIWIMDVAQEKLMRNSYKRIYQMNIRYEPLDKDEQKYETLASIGNELLEALSSIEVAVEASTKNLPVKGKQMSFQIVEGVLQFFVTYEIKGTIPKEKSPIMIEVQVNENLKY